MAETNFHRLLRARIDDRIDDMRVSISDGVCTDYSHYREVVGHIRGLLDALKLADDIEQEYD